MSDKNKTHRLVDICKKLNASTYLSGPSAKNYIDLELFKQEKIAIEWADYSNYKEVNGVMMPYTMKVTAGPQAFTFETQEVKINEGVTEEDFN